MDGRDNPRQANSSQTWAEALAEYEGLFDRQALAISWTRRVMFVFWLSLIAYPLDLHLGFKLLGIFVLVGLSFLPKPKKQATNIPFDTSQDLVNRVAASGLREKIESGSLNNEDIRKDTYLIFRWLVPCLTDDKVDLLKRVGASLEWYLVPPAIHYRKSWTFGIWCLFGSLMLACLSLVEGWLGVLSAPSLALPIGFFAFSSSLEIDTQFEGSREFIRFLRNHWKLDSASEETTQLVPHENIVAGSQLHREYSMDLIINQCDKVLDHYKQQPLTVTMWILPMLLIPSLLPLVALKQPSLIVTACIAIFVVSVVVIIGVTKILEKKSGTLEKEYKQRLTDSNLAARIVLGDATKAQLKAHIPRILRMAPDGFFLPNMPTGEGAEISADIICVALNLDWFLEHPKALIRPVWVTYPIFIAAIAGYAISFAFSTAITDWAFGFVGITGLAFWITLLQSAVRMRAGSLALIEHLREGRA